MAFLLIAGVLGAGVVADASNARNERADDASHRVKAKSPELALIGRKDLRKCRFPMCGGWFVKALNQATTPCPIGPAAAECYVASLDLSALGFAAAAEQTFTDSFGQSQALIVGVLGTSNIYGSDWGTLVGSDGYLAQTKSTPTGSFFLVRDNGKRCIKAPCPSLDVSTINTADVQPADELNLSATATPPTPDAVDAANAAVFTPAGLVVAGQVVTVSATGAHQVAASEFYLPALAVCGSRGMPACPDTSYCLYPQAANCGRSDAPGTCELRPHFCPALYKPVCGCDGKTYSNSCVAAAQGVSVDHDGECTPPAPPTSHARRPEVRGRQGAKCGGRASTCSDEQYCQFGPGANCGRADAPGVCLDKPQVCTAIYAPVCGCDGQTYGNACSAASQGVSVEREGTC